MTNEEITFAAIIGLARKMDITPEKFAELSWSEMPQNEEYLAKVLARLQELQSKKTE